MSTQRHSLIALLSIVTIICTAAFAGAITYSPTGDSQLVEPPQPPALGLAAVVVDEVVQNVDEPAPSPEPSAEVDIGLYLTGTAHDGAVADANLFDDAADCATISDSVDVFGLATVLGADRGKTMWELATLGGGTNYTVDPNLEFDITLVPGTNFDADTVLTLVATYTAGD